MQDIADLRTEIQQTAKVLQLDTGIARSNSCSNSVGQARRASDLFVPPEFQSMGNSTCMCLLKSAVQLLQVSYLVFAIAQKALVCTPTFSFLTWRHLLGTGLAAPDHMATQRRASLSGSCLGEVAHR